MSTNPAVVPVAYTTPEAVFSAVQNKSLSISEATRILTEMERSAKDLSLDSASNGAVRGWLKANASRFDSILRTGKGAEKGSKGVGLVTDSSVPGYEVHVTIKRTAEKGS